MIANSCVSLSKAVLATVLFVTGTFAQDSLESLRGRLNALQSRIESNDYRIRMVADDREIETEDDYLTRDKLRSAYDYTRVRLLMNVADMTLCQRIQKAFRLALTPSEFPVDTAYIRPNDSVEVAWTTEGIDAYIAVVSSVQSGILNENYDLVELRIIKKLTESGGFERIPGVGKVARNSSTTIQVVSRVGYQLRGIIERDETLYPDLLAAAHHSPLKVLPEKDFALPEEGPFIVKKGKELELYAATLSRFGSGFSSRQVVHDSFSRQLRSDRIEGIDTIRALGGPNRYDTIWAFTTMKVDTEFVVGGERSLEVSIFRSQLVYDEWNVDVRLGNDELGYPFWSSGQISFLVGYKDVIKLGITRPLGLGRNQDWSLIGPCRIKARALSGISGLTGRFNFSFSFPIALGGAFSTGGIEKDYGSLTSRLGFYYIPTSFQIYYPVLFKDASTNPTSIFQLKAGYGYEKINQGYFINSLSDGSTVNGKIGRKVLPSDVNTVIPVEHKEVHSPYLSLEFMSLGGDHKYGLSTQYNAGTLLIGAWVEIWKDVLRLEGKYSTFVRGREPWESSYVLLFSPRLRLDFGEWLNWR
jgi:hypothetical protein